jgi:threonine synthase
MDIQVSSNFERLLFELMERDPAATVGLMQDFRATGRMKVPESAWQRTTALFRGFATDDAGTLAEISRLHAATGYLADPHSAIGIAAARRSWQRPASPWLRWRRPILRSSRMRWCATWHPPPAAAPCRPVERKGTICGLPADLATIQAQYRHRRDGMPHEMQTRISDGASRVCH